MAGKTVHSARRHEYPAQPKTFDSRFIPPFLQNMDSTAMPAAKPEFSNRRPKPSEFSLSSAFFSGGPVHSRTLGFHWRPQERGTPSHSSWIAWKGILYVTNERTRVALASTQTIFKIIHKLERATCGGISTSYVQYDKHHLSSGVRQRRQHHRSARPACSAGEPGSGSNVVTLAIAVNQSHGHTWHHEMERTHSQRGHWARKRTQEKAGDHGSSRRAVKATTITFMLNAYATTNSLRAAVPFGIGRLDCGIPRGRFSDD